MNNNFKKSTLVTKTSNDIHEIAISDLWNVGKIPNGGYLMAHVAKAMAENSPHPHPLVITAYYLDKADVGEAKVHSELLREGKSMSTVSASLIQKDQKHPSATSASSDSEANTDSERIRFTASFTDFSFAKGETHYEESAPEIPKFDLCIPINEVAPPLPIHKQFTIRFDPGSTGWNKGNYKEFSEIKAWVEYKDQSPFDVFSLLMLPDILPPAIFCRVGPNGWVPTLEMTVNVRTLPNTSRILLRARSRYLSQSILEEDVELWDEKGNLLAICRQIAKLRMAK